MYNFFERLMSKLQGRYGIDKFEKFLFALYFIIVVVNIFIRNIIAHNTLYIIQLLLFGYMVFRFFSRNYHRRQKENQVFEKYFGGFESYFKFKVMCIKDYKTKRYRKCPHCQAVARLPIKRGKHTVKCPACKGVFEVKILF